MFFRAAFILAAVAAMAPVAAAADKPEQSASPLLEALPAAPASQTGWSRTVADRLKASKKYPPLSRRRGQQGTALIAFGVDRQGKLVSARIVRSSGHAALDREALAMVDRAQPFPPVPSAIAGDTVDLEVPVVFELAEVNAGWLRAIKQRIAAHTLPSYQRREQGIVQVGFAIDREGKLAWARVLQSSGNAALDREALAIVRRAQPYPAPALTPDHGRTFVIPIVFRPW